MPTLLHDDVSPRREGRCFCAALRDVDSTAAEDTLLTAFLGYRGLVETTQSKTNLLRRVQRDNQLIDARIRLELLKFDQLLKSVLPHVTSIAFKH